MAIALYIKKLIGSIEKNSAENLRTQLDQIFPDVLKNANEQLITMANQKLGAEKQDIKTDLDNKRREFEKLVENVEKELKESGKTAQSIMQQIKDHQSVTDKLADSTKGLTNMLSNNQLRGQFGEQVAEDLLKMSGFVKGIDFEYNKTQSTTSSRPDFAIFLPDKTRIHVDVKFPYASLQKVTETEDRGMKEQHMKQFTRDVREKIAQVTTREYINPAEKTVDFVIMFIPNEMIFSYIYDKMNGVWQEAMSRKVVLAGPFSFTAILRMVRQAYDNFRYQENIHEMVAHIKEFEKQFDLYSEEFDKLGRTLTTAVDTYGKVESTRTRQLTKIVDKIKSESSLPSFPTPAATLPPVVPTLD